MSDHFLVRIAAVLLFLTATQAAAQTRGEIEGTVADARTGAPIVDAHVFIAASMTGSVTDSEGRYRLSNVPLGAHRLYVSIVGYEPQGLDVFLRRPETHEFDFALTPAVIEIGEVEVTAKRDNRWKRRLEKFERLFIGETPNAKLTKILNPEVLDFTDKAGQFTARASETLVIENRALGYRIRYFLKEFSSTPTRVMYDGEPLFEELEPSTAEEKALWDERRAEAFNGSFRHFLLALHTNQVMEQGFQTFHRQVASNSLSAGAVPGEGRFPVDVRTIIKEGSDPQERILDFAGFIEIVYTEEIEDESYLSWQGGAWRRPKYRTSLIHLEGGPTVVDLKGDVADPYGVTFYGYLAFERVADDVPMEYRPWL